MTRLCHIFYGQHQMHLLLCPGMVSLIWFVSAHTISPCEILYYRQSFQCIEVYTVSGRALSRQILEQH